MKRDEIRAVTFQVGRGSVVRLGPPVMPSRVTAALERGFAQR